MEWDKTFFFCKIEYWNICWYQGKVELSHQILNYNQYVILSGKYKSSYIWEGKVKKGMGTGETGTWLKVQVLIIWTYVIEQDSLEFQLCPNPLINRIVEFP